MWNLGLPYGSFSLPFYEANKINNCGLRLPYIYLSIDFHILSVIQYTIPYTVKCISIYVLLTYITILELVNYTVYYHPVYFNFRR